MVINITTTQIEFFPFVSFEGIDDVTIEIWHKNTKTMVSGTSAVTTLGTKITLDLPSLTPIANVAQDLDVILFRVFNDSDAIMWEYLATWSNESTNINRTFKQWQTTDNISPQWITM